MNRIQNDRGASSKYHARQFTRESNDRNAYPGAAALSFMSRRLRTRLCMNEGLSIQHVDPHADSAAALVRALAEEEAIRYADLGPDTFDSFQPADLLTGRGVFVIASLNDEPVGCSALRQIDAETAELNRMYVAPVARRPRAPPAPQPSRSARRRWQRSS